MYWKKFVGMHIRKNKRSALVKSRKMIADIIREQRRKKREATAQAEEAAIVLESYSNRAADERVRIAALVAFVVAVSLIGGPLGWSSASRLRVH